MTKINKLVMHGFKSFAQKTELVFGNKFNCVLGPNGAGKSNILDALCFVLGRSSSKSLRAEKSANLIYNGGKKKNPSKYGEVSIWFDNSKKIFPTDDVEVKISRIVKPSGQSTYKINDETRTRQQILELLSIAKINPEGYNIILQGDIINFVQMPPVERRKLVEEISGISVYEEKREKALRELNRVEEKLKEAEIVLAERETYLKELKKERDQAQKYKEINEKINSYKASYTNKQIEKKREEKKGWQSKVDRHKTRLDSLNKKLNELKKEIINRKNKIDEINKEIESKGEKEQIQIHKEVEKLKIELATSKSRIETLQQEIKKVKERKSQLSEEIKDTEIKIKKLEKEKKEKNTAISDRKKDIESLNVKIENFRKKNQLDNVEEIEKEIDSIDKEAEEKTINITNLRGEQQDLLRKKDRLELQIQSIDEKIEKVLSLEKENREQILDLKNKKAEFKKLTVQLQSELNENSSLSAQRGEARLRLVKGEEELVRLNAKTFAMQETLSADIATKKILSSKSRFKGVHGIVSELGEVSSKYSLALEVAAGNKIKGIVVENDKVAADCIKFLKENRYGIATFFPLNRIRGRDSKDADKYKEVNGAISPAIDLISFEKKFKPVFSFIFDNMLIVENIDVARRVGIGNVKMVTLEGDLSEKSGAIRGGFRSKIKSGVSFTEKELSKNLKELEQTVSDSKSIIANIEKRKEKNENNIQKLREEKAHVEGEIIKIEKSLNLDSGDIDVNKKIKKEIREQIKETEKEVNVVESKISNVNLELAQNKIKKQNLRSKIMDLRNPALIAEITAFEEKKKELNNRIIELNSELKNIDMQINTMFGPDIENTQKIIKQHDKEGKSFVKELNELNEKIKKLNSELEEKEKKEQKFYKQFQGLFNERNKLDEDVKKYDVQIEEKIKDNHEIEIKMNSLSIESARVEAELAGLNKELDQFGEVQIIKNKSEQELKKEINEFERFIGHIGSVNMKALEVYDSAEKEYGELMGKKEKLNHEKEDVLVMMNEIETKKKGIFLKTFNVVNEHFKQIFSALSSKGEANLILENPDEPFEGGLLVKVKITGKRFIDIQSLSGGEKTLTALAFIFSIQEREPASFYVLDEVDASLDKRNTEKLAKLVKKYSEKAQYIMISHNDGVIGEADLLYGISMNEHGISNVTSLKI